MFDHQDKDLVVYDEGTDTLGYFPGKSRKVGEVEEQMRKFIGPDMDKVKLFYSDNAPEFKRLAKLLKVCPRLSTPKRPQTNARMENKQLLVRDGIKSALLQSGLPHTFRSIAGEYWCTAYNFTHVQTNRLLDQPYFNRHGKRFEEKVQPFGCASKSSISNTTPLHQYVCTIYIYTSRLSHIAQQTQDL